MTNEIKMCAEDSGERFSPGFEHEKKSVFAVFECGCSKV